MRLCGFSWLVSGMVGPGVQPSNFNNPLQKYGPDEKREGER